MTYAVTFKNNYHLAAQYPVANAYQLIGPGQQMTFPKVTNTHFTLPGVGEINLLDLGTRRICSYDKAKYGVLLSFQGKECEYRYSQDGEISLTVNDLGQVEIEAKGTLVLADLPSFILKGHAHHA